MGSKDVTICELIRLLFSPMKNIIQFLLIINISIFSFPCISSSAEVLQVTNSSLLQIGDHNRNYTIKIACFNVNPLKKEEAENWLKSSLTRKEKVNLLPRGSTDGVLIARVIRISSNKDIGKEMVELGFGSSECRV
ncbi:hypothetical protein [Prochlorococcus marinus]|uniref:hypothetical protein n=1 Tax=Prochlorococcus marinus TaxID=1219 RepID=UPI0022B32DD8|nr:hypothetical protein [Prochlorococcus marinus]